MENKPVYTRSDLTRIFTVSRPTIGHWRELGFIAGTKGINGQWFFSREEIDTILLLGKKYFAAYEKKEWPKLVYLLKQGTISHDGLLSS